MNYAPRTSDPYTLWFAFHVPLSHSDAGYWLLKTASLPFFITFLTVFVRSKYAILVMIMRDFHRSVSPNQFIEPWLSHQSLIPYKQDLVINTNQIQTCIIVDSTASKSVICGIYAITSRYSARSHKNKLVSRDKISNLLVFPCHGSLIFW